MALRQNLILVDETIQEFELAAADKIREGQHLMASGALSGGIYLLGYAAEMLLKNACDLYLGAKPSDRIGKTVETLTSVSWKGQYLPGISDESRHSIKFWAGMLDKLRDAGGNGLTGFFRLEFIQRTNSLYDTWWVSMRYRTDRASTIDAIDTLSNVGWLRNNYSPLYL